MSVRSRTGSDVLVLAILTLFVLLVLLIGSLDEMSFQPGRVSPQLQHSDDDVLTAERVIPKLGKREQIYATCWVGSRSSL